MTRHNTTDTTRHGTGSHNTGRHETLWHASQHAPPHLSTSQIRDCRFQRRSWRDDAVTQDCNGCQCGSRVAIITTDASTGTRPSDRNRRSRRRRYCRQRIKLCLQQRSSLLRVTLNEELQHGILRRRRHILGTTNVYTCMHACMHGTQSQNCSTCISDTKTSTRLARPPNRSQ